MTDGVIENYRYAGYALEKVRGEAEGEPKYHIDHTGGTLDSPADTEIEYPGSLGGGRTYHAPGFYQPSGNLSFGLDLITILDFLYFTLGNYKFTPGSYGEKNKHEFWGGSKSLLPSFTSWLGKDDFEHVFPGCVADKITLEVTNEFITVSLDVQAIRDFVNEDGLYPEEDLKLSPAKYLTFVNASTSLAKSDVSPLMKKLSVSIGNSAAPGEGQGQGNRHPYLIPCGDRVTDVAIDMRYNGLSEKEKFWGSKTGPTKDGTEEFDMGFEFDGGDDGKLWGMIPRAIYSSVQNQPSGRGLQAQPLAVKPYKDIVTLVDGVTKVKTDIYFCVENDEDNLLEGMDVEVPEEPEEEEP